MPAPKDPPSEPTRLTLQNTDMNRVLVLTGTCGSGKSTIAELLAEKHGWHRVSEDAVWRSLFHRNRGEVGSDDHRMKRVAVREGVVAIVRRHLETGDVVIDATVHETDPGSIGEYETLFAAGAIRWQIRVLHPRLDVAILRDATREEWRAGAAGVESLWRKFTGEILPEHTFLDTSDDEPHDTVRRVLASLSR